MNKESQTLLWCLWLMTTGIRADFAFTSPIGASWEIGTPNIISWQDIEGPPSPVTFDIQLMRGSPTSLQLIANVATAVDVRSGQYMWEVPSSVKPEANYVIRAGDGKLFKYSPFFEIINSQTNQTTFEDTDEPELPSPTDPQVPTSPISTSTWNPLQSMNKTNELKPVSSGVNPGGSNPSSTNTSSTSPSSSTLTLNTNNTKTTKSLNPKSNESNYLRSEWDLAIMVGLFQSYLMFD